MYTEKELDYESATSHDFTITATCADEETIFRGSISVLDIPNPSFDTPFFKADFSPENIDFN